MPRVMGCPVEVSLAALDGKWKTIILARLKTRPSRYGELRRQVPGISDKVLTERLRDLEEAGFVLREVDPAGGEDGEGSRPTVYRLTDRGESLRPVLEALYEWGKGAADELGVTVRNA